MQKRISRRQLLASGGAVVGGALLGSGILSLMSACGESDGPRRRTPLSKPNIILISLDNLRGDYFTRYRMPNLQRFARKHCAVYSRALSNSTWTKPSHLTMLTGLLQHEHGVELPDSVIPSNLVMLQQTLRDNGYETAAFTGGGFVSREWGFDRGFETYREFDFYKNESQQDFCNLPLRGVFNDGGIQFRWAEEYLSSRSSEKPLFLFVHTHIVHQYWMYDYPPDQRVSDLVGNCENKSWDDIHFVCKTSSYMIDPSRRRKLYAEAVRDCDTLVGGFLEFARDLFASRDLVMLTTSDHGEGLGEKYECEALGKEYRKYTSYLHGGPPFIDQIRIPFIVYGLGRQKTDRLVGLVDIAGAVLELAQIRNDSTRSFLGQERDSLLSEHVPLEGTKIRYSTVSTPKDTPLPFIDNRAVASPEVERKEVSPEMQRQLKALGYL